MEFEGEKDMRRNEIFEKDKVTYAFALGIRDGNFC
jgi:hypothetical protein